MTLLERINHYNRQPAHTTTVVVGNDNQQWYNVTDEDGVLIDWFPTLEQPATDQPPAQNNRRK